MTPSHLGIQGKKKIGVSSHIVGLAVTYALGDVFIKGLNYFLLPLYVHYITPEEFGILAITEMLRIIISLLISFGVTGIILRFVHVIKREKERQSFFGAMWLFLIIIPGTIILILQACGPILFHRIFPSIPFDPYIRYTLLIAYLNTAFVLLPATLYRARDQARRYVAFGISTAVCGSIAIIFHVVFQNKGAIGWVQGQLEAALIIAIISTVILIREVKLSFQWKPLIPALMFGLPLVPHFLAQWVLSVSDRMILERYVGLVQLGIYTLGYQFGQAYQAIITGVNNALIPMFGRASRELEERSLLPQITTYYFLLIAAIGLAIGLLGGEIIKIIFPQTYHGAVSIVPWVILGYLAFGSYYIPMNFMALTAGQTRAVPLASLTAACANIILNLWLVPRLGSIAAAINTAITYGFLLISTIFLASFSGRLPIELGRVGKITLSITLLYIGGRVTMRFQPRYNILIGMMLTFTLPFLLHLLRFWREDERYRIHVFFTGVVSKLYRDRR